jgi:hypothetical protein
MTTEQALQEKQADLASMKEHVGRCVLGSEPFASSLKLCEELAWDIFLLQEIDFTALQVFLSDTFVRTSNNYVGVVGGGIAQSYRTPDKPVHRPVPSPYQQEVRTGFESAMLQFEKEATWISQKLADALNESEEGTEYRHARQFQRCMRAKAAFQGRMDERFAQVKAWCAGSKQSENPRVAAFIKRHGQVHFYLDSMYPSAEAAQDAVRRDSKAISPDHDIVCSMWELALPRFGEVNQEALDELTMYINSEEHKIALQEAEEYGCDVALLSTKERVIRNVVKAVRAVTLLQSDVLPTRGLNNLGGIPVSSFKRLLRAERAVVVDEHISSRELLRVLKERLEKLRPSKKQRRRREAAIDAEIEQTAQLAAERPHSNATSPCKPGCRCIRHG